jgi:glucosyl-3-phosphoglycerate synthase
MMRELGDHHIALETAGEDHRVVKTEIPLVERPPMMEIAEYREKFHRGEERHG